MENNQVQTPPQPPVMQAPEQVATRKSNVLVIVLGGVILLGLGLLGGYFLFGNKTQLPTSKIQTSSQVSSTEALLPSTNADPETMTWKTEIRQFKNSSVVSNNEVINVALQLPSTWTMDKLTPTSTKCDLYVITSENKLIQLTIDSICSGWAATYSAWQKDSVILKEQKNVGNDGHTALIVRYFDQPTKHYKYVEGDKAGDKLIDALLFRYGAQERFLPLRISLSYNGSEAEKESTIKVADKIILSLEEK